MKDACIIAQAGLINMLEEMNNPLTNIRLSTELIETENEDSKYTYCSIIKKNAELIQVTIKELADSFLKQGFRIITAE